MITVGLPWDSRSNEQRIDVNMNELIFANELQKAVFAKKLTEFNFHSQSSMNGKSPW